MAEESKVRSALALLRQAGRMDLVREEALAPGRPVRRASAGVAAAVAACLPPRAGTGWQVRLVGRGRAVRSLRVRLGWGRGGLGGGRWARGFRGLPLGQGALRLRAGAVERRTALGMALWERRASPGQEGQGRVLRPRGLARVSGGDKWQSRA
ncbi:hypothetical protein NDU88_003942 [Pleurodeles waltl]|uniref:Uncharacterized protein n=1 Tax=Pleurodeles waltl TaxID=8319 RepID=A0AAV7QD45_PLEWA|nr:hypothetical protein NDU88_003942 [Pleurodeles waltl]